MLNYYFSPMQIGKMHRALAIKSARKYVKEDTYTAVPHEIAQNETWNFDIRMYSDIVVKKGAVLTVNGKIFMADQSRIIVKRGASLIVDGGIITSAGKTWQGIKIEGKENQRRLSKNKGVVIYKNGAVIKNVKK